MNNLIIIGGGNSIRSFPTLWDDIVGHDVMAVNNAYRYTKEPPKYLVSIDRLFWKNNLEAVNKLEKAGTKLVNRNKEHVTVKEYHEEGNLYCGSRKLSGMFALSYAHRVLKCEKIYLFGFDFGLIDGKTHFYDDVRHSGIGKDRAYLDEHGNVLDAVNDFLVYRDHDIFIIGESNINCFNKINYEVFKNDINSDR